MPTGKLFRKTANVRSVSKKEIVDDSNLKGTKTQSILPDGGGIMQLALPNIQSQLKAVIGGLETIFKTYEKYFGSIGTTLKDDIEAKIKYIEGKIETFENAMENSEKAAASSAKAAASSATEAASSATEAASSAKAAASSATAAADSAKEAKDAENSSRVYKNSTETMEDAVKKMEEKIEQIYKEILAIEKKLEPEPKPQPKPEPEPEKFPESIYITTESELPKELKEGNKDDPTSTYNALKDKDGKIRLYNGFPIYQEKQTSEAVIFGEQTPRLVYVFKAQKAGEVSDSNSLSNQVVKMPIGSLVWNWQSISVANIDKNSPSVYLYKYSYPTLNDFLKAQKLFSINDNDYYRSFSLKQESDPKPDPKPDPNPDPKNDPNPLQPPSGGTPPKSGPVPE